MRFPSIKSVAAELSVIKAGLDTYATEGEDGTEVRLQVLPDGGWDVSWGDPQYDTDHRGWWGAGYIDRRTNVRDLARDLIEEARSDKAQSE